jgi:SpoIID/LytB domain protein
MRLRHAAAASVVALLGSGLVAGGLAVVPAAPGATTAASAVTAPRGQTYYVPVTRRLSVVGHGYGHGHGMSQHGAQGAALGGKRYREILGFYYPGTELGTTKGLIRVLLTGDTTSDVVVRPARGLRVRDLGADESLRLPERSRITAWRIQPARRSASTTVVHYENTTGWHHWRTLDGDGQFAAAVPLALVLPDGSTRRYRGLLRATSPYRGAETRDTINVLSMDEYVRGVIADEMPASWHRQALRSQAVAARTYAANLRNSAGDRYYHLCDTTSCQVYGGVAAEEDTTDAAVADTAGEILRHDGAPAFTQFSASSGGWTSDGGQPYLRAQRDPWDDWSGNDVHDWSATIGVRSLEAAFPQVGRLQALLVTRRDGNGVWGGRVERVVLDGNAGRVALTGDDIRWRYGLRSSWFSFEPTPIIETWRQLGGPRSILGRPTSPEVPVDGAAGSGARQVFESGRAYWTASNGAAAVAGRVLVRYRKLGGPDSEYGFPETSLLDTADGSGRKLPLDHGLIMWSRTTGAWVLQGRVLVRYRKMHYAGGRLGYPVADMVETARVERGRFQGGVVTYNKRRNKVIVRLTD